MRIAFLDLSSAINGSKIPIDTQTAQDVILYLKRQLEFSKIDPKVVFSI